MTDSRTMTLADLLHLVDRARRGTILAPELDDLHAGITVMAERLEFTEAALSRIRDGLEVQVVRVTRRAEKAEAAIERVMDLDVPDAAAAINPAYALGWKDALAIARGVLDPAQRPAAGMGAQQS